MGGYEWIRIERWAALRASAPDGWFGRALPFEACQNCHNSQNHGGVGVVAVVAVLAGPSRGPPVCAEGVHGRGWLVDLGVYEIAR
ncbi:MAG: hypothetical protein QOE61_5787 [Micromonosporaceae bacterium]|nr:hypothetical protein [Micromonosporaceae bacterium]